MKLAKPNLQSVVVDSRHSFQGVIDEIPYIAVDYFSYVRGVSGFFLSHCHADHMKGLDSTNLYQVLQNEDIFIYCSKQTKRLLENWHQYSKLEPYLRTLEMNQTTRLKFPVGSQNSNSREQHFFVTLVPSGHCPGSVMFLFEGQFGTVLYTGDFRIARGDGRKFQAFMTNPPMSEYGLKSIDHIYVDCTFCSETAHAFPSRDASVKATTDLIQDWLNRGPDYKVLFSLAGRGFGAEFVFVEVYRRLKIKVHVSTFKLEIYKSLSNELYDSITNDATTSLHACCNNLHNDCFQRSLKNGFQPSSSEKVLTIRLSTQWHLMDGNRNDNRVVVKESKNKYRILYSMHSSLEEIQDFINVLQPLKATPIAKPENVGYKEVAKLIGCQVNAPVSRNSS